MPGTAFTWLFTLLVLGSCSSLFDYSPYAIDFNAENRDVNERNIAKISSQSNDDGVITIAFTGDSHRFYDELHDFVGAVNRMNDTLQVDFVVHVGDLADFGLPKQYLWSNSCLLNLEVPYVAVIGNHDLVSNGGDSYNTMFGPFNISFIYDSIKFILLNTNSLEFGMNGKVPDIPWLDAQLVPGPDFRKTVVLFHVGPNHGEFDERLRDAFGETLEKYGNVLFAAHGHIHSFSIYEPFADGIPFINVYGVEYRKFNVIRIKKDSINVETYAF
jgi:predicted phosphodiesterase